MRRRPGRPPLKGGLDRIGPFHPYLVFAAILALDLAAVIVIVGALVALTDWVENLL